MTMATRIHTDMRNHICGDNRRIESFVKARLEAYVMVATSIHYEFIGEAGRTASKCTRLLERRHIVLRCDFPYIIAQASMHICESVSLAVQRSDGSYVGSRSRAELS